MTDQKQQPQMKMQGRPALHPRPLPGLIQQKQGQELRLPGQGGRLVPGGAQHPP